VPARAGGLSEAEKTTRAATMSARTKSHPFHNLRATDQ